MDIAFSALVLFFAALPGFILQTAYLRGSTRSDPYVITSLGDQVAYGAVFAVPVHALWISVAHAFGFRPDLRAVFSVIAGQYGPEDSLYPRIASEAAATSSHAVLYLATLCLFSWVVGAGSKRIVRHLRLDIRYPWLRFRDEWGYLFRGELLDIEGAGSSSDVAAIYVAAVVPIVGSSGVNFFW